MAFVRVDPSQITFDSPDGMNPAMGRLIKQESGGNPMAVSPKGAQGIVQIMPATARDPGFGVTPLQNWDGVNPMSAPVAEQLRFGNDYFNAQQQRFGTPQLAAAAYNAGPGAVERVGGNIAALPAETQNYVQNVTPVNQVITTKFVKVDPSQIQFDNQQQALQQQEVPQSAPVEPSFMGRLNQNFADRKAQIGGLAEQAVAGDISQPEALARSGLKMAQLLPDAAGSAIATATPDFIKEPLTNAVTAITNTAPVRAAIGAANDFSQNHPVAAGRIGSVLDAANLVAPFAKVGGKSVINTAADNTLPAVQKAGQVAADLRVPLSEDKALLNDMGVRLTSGQRAGGLVQSLENKATSIPIVGDAIGGAYKRGIDDFNRGVTNEVTSSIGAKLPKDISTGSDAVSYAKSAISKSYDSVLPKMTGNLDNQFMADLSSHLQNLDRLPDAKATQVQNILTDSLLRFADPKTGQILGKDIKEVMTRLKKDARDFSSSADPDQRAMGEIIANVSESFSNTLQRQNPAQLAHELAATDLAYAKYVRLRQAAASSGAANNGGVFTPAQLMSAVRTTDKSVGKGSVATGDALLQDIALAGQRVLPNKVPDSGTATRFLAGAGLAGGLGMVNPVLLAGGGLAAAAYTRPGQAVIRGASKLVRK